MRATSQINEILGGNRLALAQLLTRIENQDPESYEALDLLFPYSGKAHLIGVTGSPGTGKSSLVNQLARFFRRSSPQTFRIGIVAVDPTSPFSGGAILGDRVRMRDLAGDSGVFIRSMASRGSLGGLALTTSGLVQALDAAGYEMIFIETVGAGQAEVDIARLAHTTLVVEAPGLGDDIQAIKAGILEIADLLIINKADHAGVESTERALRSMFYLRHPQYSSLENEQIEPGHHHHLTGSQENTGTGQDRIWIPPILKTVATEGVGIQQAAEEILQHKVFLVKTGKWQHRGNARLKAELDELIKDALLSRWQESLNSLQYKYVLEALYERRISPHQALSKLV